jgi:tRNA(His) guanylyltransferase
MKREKNALTTRMKENYELRCRHGFPRRTHVIVRVDGRAFHTWTRGLRKPYDPDFMACMDAAALALCKEASGCKLGYVQSDEISLLLTDYDSVETQAWFDNCQDKIESITASIATMAFNQYVGWLRQDFFLGINPEGVKAHPIAGKKPDATFDSRAFVIPDYVEVENYFIDRQKDAIRNSITMLASAHASPKQLLGKKSADRLVLVGKAGFEWEKQPVRFRHGAAVRKTEDGWMVDSDTPEFAKRRDFLRNSIPRHWQEDENA